MGYELGLQSNQLKDFSVSIKGIKLTNTQIISIKLKWNIDGFKVIGEMVFDDFTNLIENLPIRGNEEVIMAMTDFDDTVSRQKFNITDVRYTRVQSGKPVVKLMLIDNLSILMTQMYPEMSWSSADMIEIIDHNETLKPLLTEKKKNFIGGLNKHENFVVPLHVSFNIVCHWLAKNNNVLWFQSRDEYIIQPLSKLFSLPKKGDKFRYQTPNSSYRRKIYEYRVHFGKVLQTNAFLSNAKVASFDVTSKDPKWTSEDYSSSISRLSSKGLVDPVFPGTDNRHFYKSDYHIQEYADNMWDKNSYRILELEILVPGKFDTNIGDIVELDVVNYNNPTQQESNINGEWMIIEITDIISPPDYIMRMVLARAKFST